jgi:serine/threonine-protein phosphatase PP1 catalytic subunit
MASACSRLDTLLDSCLYSPRSDYHFCSSDAQWLCQTVSTVFLAESSLLRIPAPVNICGDIHGQLSDLMRSLDSGGFPPFTSWLFLGDYVDRGPQSVEVICLLFALKIRYPQHVFMIRGNHESLEMTAVFGFADECKRKLNIHIWQEFCQVFETLPLAAVVGQSLFCVHGGISPDLHSLSQIEQIARPVQIPTKGMITDMLWSDPHPAVVHFGPNDRGTTVTWGVQAARAFLRRNRLDKIVRAHQVAMRGYEFPFAPDESVVTMFTASNYTLGTPNRAAFLVVRSDHDFDFRVLPAFPGTLMRPRASSTMETRPTESGRGIHSGKRKVTVHLSAPSLRPGKGVFSPQRTGTRLGHRTD